MNKQALTDNLGQYSWAVYASNTVNYKVCRKASSLSPPNIKELYCIYWQALLSERAVNHSELKLRCRLLYCPCVLATSSSCRLDFMLRACSVASSACVVGGCCAALNADQLWWCHSLWRHTRWGMDRGERQKGRTDKEITHVLSRCSQNSSSTSFRSE